MPRDSRKPFVLSTRLKVRAIIGAVAVHVLIVGLLVVSFTVTPEKTGAPPQPEIINAVTVDANEVEQEIEKLRAAERREQEARQRKAREAELARKREQQRLARLREQREQERQQRLAEQKKEKERLARLEAEKKRLAEERRKEQERLRKLEEQRRAEQERKRKEEEARRRAEEQRRKEEEARRLAEEKRRKEEQARIERELKEKLAAEQQRLDQEQQQLAAAERARQQTVIERYVELIKAKVRRNWIVPPSARQGMDCVVQVRLLPSGEVVSVQLTQSSGSEAFDRSVEHAVRKASPLPLPPAEQNLFDEFRVLRFPFTLERTT